ncbi:PucR family transcriptional regulator [Patulibacter defluvii]|uniref:PucR family transcriptional regulator n=1 Tax=Patulibacter defluvii TaxID=3095358 RepID=UPI002A761CC6|nr:helix-turn-helix domain-containing protein [Patulibacter sp. DM4]
MEVTATQRIVERLVRAVAEREDELVERMLERFAIEAPGAGVGADPDLTEVVRRSSYDNLRAALRHVTDGGDPLPDGPPPAAVEEARESARAGMSLVAGLQTYRIGQAVVWDAMLDAIDRLEEDDPAARSAALRTASARAFAFVDAIVPHVMEVYTRERDRLLRSREQRRVQLVRDLLDGEHVDSGELGYDLIGRHRAAIAWGPGSEAELTRLAAALRTPVLVVAVGGQTAWGWLGAGADDDRALRAALEPWPGRLAFGRADTGPEGFRRSHGQARAAHRIGAATGDPLTCFDDVALESVMLADEEAARAFVAAELARLDDGRDGAKLRETLSAYFACGFNASAAAALLGVNDRTIAYRLRSIEQRLGRPVRRRQTELQAAIRLERVLRAGAGRPD